MFRLRLVLSCCVASTLAAFGARAAEEKVLYVYNYADYIGETTLEDFTKETGIKVVYDTYDGAETVQAKLMAGHTGYDVVVHSASSYGPQDIAAGVFLKLDKSKLPNLKHMDPEVMKSYEAYDPGAAYGVPYMWGTTGFTYNVDMIKARMPDAPVDSLRMIFDPDVVKKFADCGVSFLDSPADILPLALFYLGLDPNSKNPGDYDKAKEVLMKVRPYVRTFDNSNYLTALPQKSICLATTWSGDYATAAANAEDAGVKIDLAYTIPKEGSILWFDAMYITSDSKHPDNAHKFIDFISRPDVVAKISDYTNYANANKDATALMDPAVTGNPAIYPDEATLKRSVGGEPLPQKAERARTRAYSEFKTGT